MIGMLNPSRTFGRTVPELFRLTPVLVRSVAQLVGALVNVLRVRKSVSNRVHALLCVLLHHRQSLLAICLRLRHEAMSTRSQEGLVGVMRPMPFRDVCLSDRFQLDGAP